MNKKNAQPHSGTGAVTNNTLCFVAGNSGGHIIPCITLAKRAVHEDPSTRIVLFTTARELDARIVQNESIVDRHIALKLPPFPGKKFWFYPLFTLQLIRATLHARRILIQEDPRKVVSTGSHISLPVCLATWWLSIPLELYELNVQPGKALRACAPFATKINTCFSQTHKHLPAQNCALTPYPVREVYTTAPAREDARRELRFLPDVHTIFILGGSQGSVFLNNAVKKWLASCDDPTQYQIIHQTGSHDPTDWDVIYKTYGIRAHVFTYADNLALFYAAADTIVCRAGAGSLFEALHFKKPCIVIPLEHGAAGHQIKNAHAMAQEYPELFHVIREEKIKTHGFTPQW